MPNKYQYKPAPLRVGLVVFPGCMPAGLFATADTLRGANARSEQDLFAVDWLSVSRAPVPVWGGQALQPTALLREEHDVYLVPGLWASSERELLAALEQRALLEALAAVPSTSALWSYCAGVLLVAAARRLDGRRATATWWMQQLLTARFPRVRWTLDEPLVVSGNTATAAGAHGYLALVQEQLRRTLTPTVSRDVVDLLMLPEPRTLHPLFRGLEVTNVAEELREVLSHALKTDAAELDLRSAASSAGLSVRTLCRRVHTHTGGTAGEWLRRVKLKQAAEALIRTKQSAKQISLGLGFSSEASFHRTFREVVGLTPLAFRQAYGERLHRRRRSQ